MTATASPVQHYAGARLTRVTYEGRRIDDNGAVVKCGHWGHKTAEAAIRCAEATR